MIGVLAVCAPVLTGRAEAAQPSGVESACTRLPRQPLSLAPENATVITEAALALATETRPAACVARGYVAPNSGFELAMPVAGWNGKFFYAGCTGSCGIAAGSVWVKECDYPLSRGYACIISDMGHRGSPADGLWAWRNIEAKLDFAFRATHRTAVAGKAVVKAFYSKAPARSYFMGCSTGGRQALVSAQRFPHDFDGIIAGAPVISEAGTSMSFVWTLNRLRRADGSSLFDARSLTLLHRGALAALDGADGRQDGVIDDPRAGFDPAALQCRPGGKGDCLSAEQVKTAREVYAGPTDSRGRPVYFGGGFLPGSELGWRSFLPLNGPASASQSGTDTTRFIQSDFGPAWESGDFDFDRDPDRLREYEILYSASQPDLRAFRDAGGKLLIYHGWADARVAPLNSVDYYAMLVRAMGGPERTADFARLFMVPGMDHCWGGAGPFAIDYIAAMEAWVERGEAPAALRAAHRPAAAADAHGPTFIHAFPADRADEDAVRILPAWTAGSAEPSVAAPAR